MSFVERGGGIAAAAPEVLAAGAYAAAWFAPAALDPGFVRGLMLALLIEFLVIHSFAFLSVSVMPSAHPSGPSWRGRLSKMPRVLAVLGFGAIYVLFAGALSLAFASRAPLWSMLWLVGSRLLTIVLDRQPSNLESERQMRLWIGSAALYLFGAFFTAIVPMPRLGLTPDVVAGLSLPGSGLWIEKPQTVVAFGLIYFGGLAALEIREALRSTATRQPA